VRLEDLHDWKRRIALGERPSAIQLVEWLEELINYRIGDDDDEA